MGEDGGRPPLLRLYDELVRVGRLLHTASQEAETIRRHIEGWTLVFHGCGSLAGAVPSWQLKAGSDGVADYRTYEFARRSGLVGIGAIAENDLFVVGDSCEGDEWEAAAAEAGVELPLLIRPVEIESEEGERIVQESMYGEGEQQRVAQDIEAVSTIALDLKLALQTMDYLRQCLESVEQLTSSLSKELTEALDAVSAPHWRPRIRRHLIVGLRSWPIVDNDRELPLPRTPRAYAAAVLAQDPRQHWGELRKLAGGLIDDIAAVSSELQPNAGNADTIREASSEPPVPSWSTSQVPSECRIPVSDEPCTLAAAANRFNVDKSTISRLRVKPAGKLGAAYVYRYREIETARTAKEAPSGS